MDIFQQTLQVIPEFLMISILAYSIFLAFYSIVSALHLSKRWIILGIAALLLVFSVVRVAPPILRQPTQIPQNLAAIGGMIGLVAVVSTLYAFSQWIVRGGYRLIKVRSAIRNTGRNVLVYLRKHHQLLGWVAMSMATLHMLFYVPLFATRPWQQVLTQPAVVSGAVVWLILAASVALGWWLDRPGKSKRTLSHHIHVGTAVFFFFFLVIHVGAKLMMR